MTPKQTQLLHILHLAASQSNYTIADLQVFEELFIDWFEAVKSERITKLAAKANDNVLLRANIQALTPFFGVWKAIQDGDTAGAVRVFPDAFADYLEIFANQLSEKDGPVEDGIVDFVNLYRSAPDDIQPLFEKGMRTLLEVARLRLFSVLDYQSLVAMVSALPTVDLKEMRNIIDDSFAFIEIALDHMSMGRRESRREHYLNLSSDNPERFHNVLTCRDKEKLYEAILPLLNMLRVEFNETEELGVEDPDYRMLSHLRIEHAIVVRQHSFKARPKYFNCVDAAQSCLL